MNNAKTVTHLLFPLFIGFIIGGAISGNTAFLVWGIVLLVLDIIVGVALQYALENAQRSSAWNGLSPEEKRAFALAVLERLKRNIEAEELDLCERMDSIFARLRIGGKRSVSNIVEDPACRFLLDVCAQLSHAPLVDSFAKIYAVSAEDWGGTHAIMYAFRYSPISVCENACIFLVQAKENKIRLFAVETDFGSLALCEYSGNSHLNYGTVEKYEVPTKIKTILEGREQPDVMSSFK